MKKLWPCIHTGQCRHRICREVERMIQREKKKKAARMNATVGGRGA